MSHWIRNYNEISGTPLREKALAIVESAFDAIDTEKALRNAIYVDGEILHIAEKTFDLNSFENVYVLGFGKVSCKATEVLESILGERVSGGVAIGIKESACQIIETYAGTHPRPSEVNFKATEKIQILSEKATEKDLVLVIVSGGGSALLCASETECDQGQILYDAFLKTGGDIKELNIVRKHLSNIKGGGLAKLLYPATVVGLIFSDVPAENPRTVCETIASGPTCLDTTTITNAQNIIDKYSLGPFELNETPKNSKYFEKVTNIILVSNITALVAMEKRTKELGFTSILATSNLYNFPEEVCALLQKHATAGTAVIAGGETRLVIPKDCDGKGGRNDFLAFTMAERILEKQVFVSLASDGKDNTDAAGAIVDSNTIPRSAKKNIDIEKHRACLDSYTFFDVIGGHLIKTGPIEANVSDLMILLTDNDK